MVLFDTNKYLCLLLSNNIVW